MRVQFVLVAAALCACRSNQTETHEEWRASYPLEASSSIKATDASTSQQAAAQTTGEQQKAASGSLKAVSDDDRDFIIKAVQGGLFEIESSRLALDKNTDESIHEFAQMLVDDHERANRELLTIADRKNARPPNAMSNDQKRDIDDLQRLTGVEFDQRYYQLQVEAHDKAIELFEHASSGGQDADLRSFATKVLPTLREHRRYLEQHPM